ncbi:MAG: TraB/GumN family protein [Desulfosarcina sp.]|nr:TraB/GumN family protein [Desulfobacterales bacterium]
MPGINKNDAVHHIDLEDKEIIIIGTAHVSKESAELVQSVINEEKPDTVCVELCESRYQAIRQKKKWLEMDIIKVIKEKKAFLLLSNLLLASFQRRIAAKLEVKPGEEMLRAIETGESVGAEIYLADRDIRITLSRTWRIMGLWQKIKLLFQMVISLGQVDDIDKEEIERMKQEDILETILSEVGESMPVLKKILIDERDLYLTSRIKSAPGKKIVAVVGAGHVPGIKNHFHEHIDLSELEQTPPKSKASGFIKWLIPSVIGLFIIIGFFYGGAGTGTDMVKWWIIANGLFAGIGAIIALAHPLTIFSSIMAAPLTSLNPMIAAGWVSGLVEAMMRKPKVKDLENLSQDILSIKGFWGNKVTRILLVVVFTNLGSSLGTFVAIPLMLKVL